MKGKKPTPMPPNNASPAPIPNVSTGVCINPYLSMSPTSVADLVLAIGKAHENEAVRHQCTQQALNTEKNQRITAEQAVWRWREQARWAEHFRLMLERRAEEDPVFIQLRAQLDQAQSQIARLQSHTAALNEELQRTRNDQVRHAPPFHIVSSSYIANVRRRALDRR